ncbi:MAG: LysM domain-containing protein, partial [Sodaliphilus sp.]|nr:LysM domain-containing protein [Sodaliphilus sp.]
SSKRRKADRDSDRRSKRKAKKEEDARPTSHSVREGESLERIAHRYGLGTDQLRKANPQLKDADMLHPGDKLKVPKANKKKKNAKKEETTSKKKRRR